VRVHRARVNHTVVFPHIAQKLVARLHATRALRENREQFKFRRRHFDGLVLPRHDVARQINVVRQLKARAPKNLVLIGTAYSYLQEYLPHVAQYVVRNNWTDMIGLGRMVLSYPEILTDATTRGALTPKLICRTFSDCTTAPRNGMISGCYPLDKFYSAKPEFQKLKEVKKAVGA